MLDSSDRSQNISVVSSQGSGMEIEGGKLLHALLACLDFSFSNILCDCNLVALILAVWTEIVVLKEGGLPGWVE